MRRQYMRLFGSELPQRKMSRLNFENMRFLFVRPFLVVRAKMIGANAGNLKKRLSIATWCTIQRLAGQGFKKKINLIRT